MKLHSTVALVWGLILFTLLGGCTKTKPEPVVSVPFTVIDSWNGGAGRVICITPEDANKDFLGKLELQLRREAISQITIVAVLDDDKAARMYRDTNLSKSDETYLMKHLIAVYKNNKNTKLDEFTLMKELTQ